NGATCAARATTATSRFVKGGRSPGHRAGRCHGSRWRSETATFTPPEWSYEPYESSTYALATGDDLQRHQPARRPAGGIAVMAADGNDERLAGRGFLNRLAGGAREPRLLRGQPVPVAPGPLSPETVGVTCHRPRRGELAPPCEACRRTSL